jgi:hypothetical protein
LQNQIADIMVVLVFVGLRSKLDEIAFLRWKRA